MANGQGNQMAKNSDLNMAFNQTPQLASGVNSVGNGKSYHRGRWHVMDFENIENKHPTNHVNMPMPQKQQQPPQQPPQQQQPQQQQQQFNMNNHLVHQQQGTPKLNGLRNTNTNNNNNTSNMNYTAGDVISNKSDDSTPTAYYTNRECLIEKIYI